MSLILLTYYTTVFQVYGRIALSGSSKAHAATGVIIVYNFLVSRTAGSWAAGTDWLRLTPPGVHVVVELLCGSSYGAGESAARLAA